jgi:eukaryotic-like serine/threonine-protein kinase
MPLSPNTTLGHYEVLSQLGAGGMGEVYLAHDTRLNRKVALKILPAELINNRERLHRFEQEARAASALNHPNIITIHEIGAEGDTHFIATEYIEGATLRRSLQTTRLEIKETLSIAIQIAAALDAAHRGGIVHRDIKPENIMRRQDGIVKVLDFGLAKLSEKTARAVETEAATKALVQTEPGTVMGTAAYMSPEQVRGLAVDARTDIFSLGIVIYEMVAGRAPFAGATKSDLIVALLERDPPSLVHVTREVPAELERLVMKALAKDIDERYQTAKDLLIDLKRLTQKLKVDAEIERKAPSEGFRVPSSGGRLSSAESSPPKGGTLSGAAAPTAVDGSAATSSVEYIVSEIKRHKTSAGIAVAALAIALAAAAYFYLPRAGKGLIDSVAVLPLVNQNNDPNTEYLSDGITESIINSLSQLPNLKVMSRNSVFHYKGKDIDVQAVAKELKVQAVLTGRVTQRGDGLSISVELINAQDNSQIWGRQYNRKLADVFAVQEEMSKEISEKLRLKLTGAEKQQLAKRPTENIKAFQYYMQGRVYSHRRTREDLVTAIRYCEKAIEEDRNYALAYAGLADAYTNLGSRGYIVPFEGKRKAEEAARKALALDENLAEAHATLGSVYTLFAPPNFSLGDRELRRAIELSPNLAIAYQHLGISLVQQGRFDEALEELLKARELDPLSSIIARAAASPYYFKRDYERALELLRQANELGPAFSTTWEIGVYIQNRSFDEAVAELEKAKRERKSDPMLIYSTAMVYAAQGRRAEVLQIIKEMEEMSGASLRYAQWIAKIYASLNEKELALTWLERGLAAGAITLFFKDEPVWDAIRSDPRFVDLLRRMGLTP